MGQCLIVLGMHRSGTSCLTGILQDCGLVLGDVFTQNPYNKRGNRERAEIQALNNDVLETNGGAWDRPVLVTEWTPKQKRLRDEILARFPSGLGLWWGFKDPRVLLTLPFWLESIENPNFIGTYRHPHRVALSLQNRDRMALGDSYRLWLTYNKRLIECIKCFQIQFVDFDLGDAEYKKDVAEKVGRLGLTFRRNRSFFDPKLRTQSLQSTEGCDLPIEVEEVYKKLKEMHAAL